MSQVSIVLRTPSGLSGDMLLTGLARLSQTSDTELSAMIGALRVPALVGSTGIRPHNVKGITGWKAFIDLPHEHHHRTLKTILAIIARSVLPDAAKELASRAFTILGAAEAKVHDTPLEAVHFHEVGALDSILDICVAAALYTKLAPARFHCSALPLCDGTINCEHGLLASPPPALQEMLEGVPVYGADAQGETVTPTALAFLRAAGAIFGRWPHCEVRASARVYGGKVFANLPNGAMFFTVVEP